jgi:Cu(I)/Ag(I) efflux system protein CusF
MKYVLPCLAILLLAGCDRTADAPVPAGATPTTASTETAPVAEAPAATEAKRASARGVVQSIDVAAKSITIAHGPVEALGWPGMTMTFQAPAADLTTIKVGDEVDFEFTSTGMNGTIESISKR